jgi:asparagine synthase (glutamine-hydrolysing)
MIERMCDFIAHRGPDGAGTLVDGAVGLGHRRLAVLDLSPAGRQPMSDSDGSLSITFNGEIYNFLELRAELESRGHRFRSRTDTEVLLASYREFGIECLDRLRGMFAFAIWDAPQRSLFIARDRLGKKPLHYLLDRDGIAFASEPKAFLADPSFSARPNAEAISHYLTYQYVPSPLSPFEGVSKLPPAHYMLVQHGSVRIQRYWKLRYSKKRRLTEEEAAEELLARLKEAVRLRLLSDVPLGAFLSGGIDSSAIVALMAEVGGARVKTFSIGFEEQDYNELPYAREVAERYDTDHHEFIVRPDATDILPKLVWHYNEPYADESAIPTMYLSELTRQHVTVALNGDAGDENFAGYSRYIPSAAAERYARVPAGVRAALERVERAVPPPRHSDAVIWRGKRWFRAISASPERRYARRLMHFDPWLKEALCTPGFLEASGGGDSTELLLDAYRATDAPDFLDATLDVDVTHYLPDCLLVKVDIATMAFGLEARSPLLDHEFMEFAASLPSAMKLRGTVRKHIFKKALGHLLPAGVISRPKMGFGVPLEYWLRGQLREMAQDLLLSRRHHARGYFKPAFVSRLLNEHISGVVRWHDQLYNLIMLEIWHQTFVDGRPGVTADLGAVVIRDAPAASEVLEPSGGPTTSPASQSEIVPRVTVP